MTRFHEITATTPALGTRGRMRDMFAVAIACIVLFGLLAAAAFAVGPLQSQPTEGTTHAEVVDGWMPAVTFANRKRAISDANGVVDGWASGLLKPEPEIVDGWAARYLVDDD
jgi:hypothetical protein